MPFSPLFTASQVLGAPSNIVLTDVSTGSDAAIASRVVYLRETNGDYLVPSGTATTYIVWPYADSTITMNVLSKDMALIITVNWLDVNGAVLYTATSTALGFTLYNETFDYYTTQMLSANPLLINDTNFWGNKKTIRTYIDAGDNALRYANDQYAGQFCFDEATKLRLSSQYYFNANS